MIEIKKASNCCGCGVCSQVCPKQCIKMEYDREGFAYPVVNKDTCINCNQCKKSCPILNSAKEKTIIQEVYAAYYMDEEVRLSSSSGGIFTAIAEAVIDDGGIVFGASFDRDWSVKHISVESKKDISLLRGSKYTQSRIETCYQEAKMALEGKRPVLWSGTGCQIAGLKCFLGKDYPNLLTVDILCHGVPSTKLWKQYLSEKENQFNSSVKKVFFRNKDYGWKNFSLKMEFSNGEEYNTSFKNDVYMQLFLNNICLRPSCHDCKFKTVNSYADITLGDCWGIDKWLPEMDDDRGVSVVIIHTNKGNAAFQQIQRSVILRKAELQQVYQSMMYDSVNAHPHRKRFFDALDGEERTQDLKILLKRSFSEKIFSKLKRLLFSSIT